MLERLKSLPLTFVLTILIWMYAESQVRTVPETFMREIKGVPVQIMASPEVINTYDIMVEPTSVTVLITGARDLEGELLPGHISAYLDISSDDIRVASNHDKSLRFSTPQGISVTNPPTVSFMLKRRASVTQPH